MTTVRTLPPAPDDTTDSYAVFSDKANTFTAALSDLVSDVNAVKSEVTADLTSSNSKVAEAAVYAGLCTSGPSTHTTSNSTITPALGAKTFTIPASTDFCIGMHVMIVETAAPATNWMHGMITTHTTGGTSLVVTVDQISTTVSEASAWTISLSAPIKFLDTNATCATYNGEITQQSASELTCTVTATLQPRKSFVPGMWVMMASTADPTNWLHGIVASYNSTTGAFEATVDINGFSDPAFNPPSYPLTISASSLPQNQNILGVGQGLQSPGRAAATVYQNTTDKPIYVMITVVADGSTGSEIYAELAIGATSSPNSKADTVTILDLTGSYRTLTAVVPPDYYYKLTKSNNFSISAWFEIR